MLRREYFSRSKDFIPVSLEFLDEVIAIRKLISEELNLNSKENEVLESFLSMGIFPPITKERESVSSFLSLICLNCGNCCKNFCVDEDGNGISEQIPGGTQRDPRFKSPCPWLSIDEKKRLFSCLRYEDTRPSLCKNFQCPWAFTLGIVSGHNLEWDIQTWWDHFHPKQ